VGVERMGLDRGELVVEASRDEFAVHRAVHTEMSLARAGWFLAWCRMARWMT
jgi:hypothetical protein